MRSSNKLRFFFSSSFFLFFFFFFSDRRTENRRTRMMNVYEVSPLRRWNLWIKRAFDSSIFHFFVRSTDCGSKLTIQLYLDAIVIVILSNEGYFGDNWQMIYHRYNEKLYLECGCRIWIMFGLKYLYFIVDIILLLF